MFVPSMTCIAWNPIFVASKQLIVEPPTTPVLKDTILYNSGRGGCSEDQCINFSQPASSLIWRDGLASTCCSVEEEKTFTNSSTHSDTCCIIGMPSVHFVKTLLVTPLPRVRSSDCSRSLARTFRSA
ncbi:hypothetical protein JTB14_018351 [Gonioctena quinquepunctata]|nr:hypothetical protein JTB14_018351 [Gonioctena quinquepunctata]